MAALNDVFAGSETVDGKHSLYALPAEGIDGAISEAFRRRGYAEKYQKEETPVREDAVKKLSQVSANYRSAFSAARCADCAHFQAGSKTCELVEGPIDPDSVCDLYEPKREDATEKANRLFAERDLRA